MSTETGDFDERELETMRGSLAGDVAAYRAEMDGLEPSSRHRAAMERMLVELVREDVRRQWKGQSLRSSARLAWRRWNDAWRDLVERSFVFRLASQGAMALGAGLVLAILLNAGESANALAEPVMETPRQEPTPVPASDSVGADRFRRSLQDADRRGLASPIPKKK